MGRVFLAEGRAETEGGKVEVDLEKEVLLWKSVEFEAEEAGLSLQLGVLFCEGLPCRGL